MSKYLLVMRPSRREILSVIAGSSIAGFSACLGSNNQMQSRSISIEIPNQAEELRKYFDFNVELVENPSENTPGRIQISVELKKENSEMDDSTFEISFGQTPPFSSYIGRAENERIAAIPDNNSHIVAMRGEKPDSWIPSEPNNGCWQVNGFPNTPEQDESNRITVSRDDDISEEYTLLSYSSTCFEEGKYEFYSTEPYRIFRDGEEIVHRYTDVNLKFHIVIE